MSQLERYTRYFGDIPGWFEKPAVALWDTLLSWQEQRGLSGDLLEIGVWKGRSAALMALHCKQGESCLFVDSQSMADAKLRIEGAIPEAHCVYLQKSSRLLTHDPSFQASVGKVRWMHIDGEHSSESVTCDLKNADLVLMQTGIVAVDDFFSPAYPQVTQAVFQFLITRPSRFTLLLCGFNKAYLSRPTAARQYLELIKSSLFKEMLSRDIPEITIWRTTAPADMLAFGITDRYLNFDYRGPDWDELNIPI